MDCKDLVAENERLREQVAALRLELENAQYAVERLNRENIEMHNRLHDLARKENKQ